MPMTMPMKRFGPESRFICGGGEMVFIVAIREGTRCQEGYWGTANVQRGQLVGEDSQWRLSRGGAICDIAKLFGAWTIGLREDAFGIPDSHQLVQP